MTSWLYGLACGLGAVVLRSLMAAETDPLPLLAQWGLAAPLMGALWWVYRREATRADRLEEKLLEAIPALTQATLALNESTEMLRDIHRDRNR